MAQWNLSEIRSKVRQVSGRLSTNEMSNEILDDYINKYYQFTFPEEVKLDRKHTYYEFDTVANQSLYDLPNTAVGSVPAYTNFEPPATLDNLLLDWFQEPQAFFSLNPHQVSRSNANIGNGVITNFSLNSLPFPIMPGSVIVTDNVEKLEDTSTVWTTGNVSLTSDGAGNGTVNYSTGAINVNFAVAPAVGQIIYFSWISFKAGRPTSVLLYNNQFQFFTVPDTAYRFKVKAYAIVSPLVNGTDKPELEHWGPCIAYGACRIIHSDYGEMDAYQEVNALYKEQLDYVLRRTHQNLLNTRSVPRF